MAIIASTQAFFMAGLYPSRPKLAQELNE
jgi:hypothetical protein